MKIALLPVILCIAVTTFDVGAVGESAVITLEFPAGAENTGMGETNLRCNLVRHSGYYYD